jgi:hypothetical protein
MPKVNDFQKAINATVHLKWRVGLSAVKKGEGKGQINVSNRKVLLGNAYMDGDCASDFPNTCRWDYAIGYYRANRTIAYFVEVHSAETSEISKMERKLQWLFDYLREDSQHELCALKREIHWVASGRINIPKHTPQYRKLSTTLRKRGLKGPVKSLVLA